MERNYSTGQYIKHALLHSEDKSPLKSILQTGIDKELKFYGMDKGNYYEMTHFTRLFHLDELKQTEKRDMRSGSYVIETIEAAVAGGLAGLYYGVDAIPKDWLDEITQKEYVEELCERAKHFILMEFISS